MRRLNTFITILPLAVALLLLLLRTPRCMGTPGRYSSSKATRSSFTVGVRGFILLLLNLMNPYPASLSFALKKIVFRRPLELSNFSSRSVHTIVFEVDDRETIGGSAYGGQRAVCCTADLAKLGVCTEGQIIHRPSTNNRGWPQVFGASFDVDKTETTLQPRSIQITKTGMYNLYFIHCDPRLKEVAVNVKTVEKSYWLPTR